MSQVEQLEQGVLNLSAEQRAEFDAWYANLQADEWDRRFEQDVAAGNFDKLTEELRAEIRAGRTRAL